MTSNASDTLACVPVKQEVAEWLLSQVRNCWGPHACLAGAEVGVKQGYLALELLRADASLSLHLVDHWRAGDVSYRRTGDPAAVATTEQHREWYWQAVKRLLPHRARCTWHIDDSIVVAQSGEIPPLHFVFLDADHSYQGRLDDLLAWSPHVLRGGLIAGGLWSSHYGGDCCGRAVMQFLAEQGWSRQVAFGPHKTWGFAKP